jgi:hypothetical protein
MVTEKLTVPASLSDFFDSENSTMSPYNTGYTFFVYGTLPIFVTKYVGFALGWNSYYYVHIVGRILVALFDILTLLCVYSLGRLVFSSRVGLVAAALFALVPQNIQLSHFFGVENYSACFVCLGFLLACGALYPHEESRSSRFIAEWRVWIGLGIVSAVVLLSVLSGLSWYAVAQLAVIAGAVAFTLACYRSCGFLIRCLVLGLLLGFALASKVSTAFAIPFIAVPMLVGLFVSAGGAMLQMLMPGGKQMGADRIPPLPHVVAGGVLTLATMLLTFRVFQPYAFGGTSFFTFHFADLFLRNMQEVSGLMTGADIPPGVFWVNRLPFLFHWGNMLWWQMGILWFVACWGGLVMLGGRMLLTPSAAILSWFLWTLFWFSYNAVQFVKAGRYLSLVYPFFALAAGYAVV